MTSLLEPNRPVLELFLGFPLWGKVIDRRDIDTVRLDDVPETKGVDYIKIDIQGGELMALQNATERLKEALLIHTEVEFLPMYADQPLYADIDLFLRGHGFMIHKFEPMVSRAVKPLMKGSDMNGGFGQILWADAIFIRDITQLERLRADQLLRLAVILHDCYGSYDVALRLLLEYDRRGATRYAQTYIETVTGPGRPPVQSYPSPDAG